MRRDPSVPCGAYSHDLSHGLCKIVRARVGSAPENYTNAASVWRLRFTALTLLVPNPGEQISELLATCSSGATGSSGVTLMGLQPRAPLIRTVMVCPYLSSACASALRDLQQHCLTLWHTSFMINAILQVTGEKIFLFKKISPSGSLSSLKLEKVPSECLFHLETLKAVVTLWRRAAVGEEDIVCSEFMLVGWWTSCLWGNTCQFSQTA